MQDDLNKIAIVGMACRLPLANSREEYWTNLIEGKICTQQTRSWPDGTTAKGGFLEHIDAFDESFFNISPAEAKCMDPQLRLLLETSYEAIDCSGASINTLKHLNTGVFTTSLPGDYKNLLALNSQTATSTHSFIGNAPSAMSGRLSYYYDFHGPSISIDTACSSGLTTLNMAQLSILNGDCNAALVGGASIFSTSAFHQLAGESKMLSINHQCAAFDDSANGFVASEGIVVLLIMKYTIAHELQLPIYGLIESLHLNHNGFSNGLMAPNSKQQHQLIKYCYQQSKKQLADIALIETHGTGTKLGDPIELKGLEDIFSNTNQNETCYLGASKTIIGHTLVCSSLASIVKVLLSYENQLIPPHPLFRTANSHGAIPTYLKINTKITPWPQNKFYAGISAFGFTGSNAHLILKFLEKQNISSHMFEEYFIFSAKDEPALFEILTSIKQLLLNDLINLTDLSIRLMKRPKHFGFRIAIFSKNKNELLQLMTEILEERIYEPSQVKITQQYRDLNNVTLHPQILQWLQGIDDVLNDIKLPIPFKPLPSYPFNKNHHWVGSSPSSTTEESLSDKPIEILYTIKEGLRDILGYDEEGIDESKSLLELGLDSLTGIQLMRFLKNNRITTTVDWIWEASSLFVFADNLSYDKTSPHPFIFNSIEIEKLQFISTHTKTMAWLVSNNAGKPLLLLPPLNCHYLAWLRQISFLHQHGYQLHIPNYPGHHSDATSEGVLSLPLLADEIRHYCESLQEKPHLVGWSLGGVLGLLLAIENQNCIQSLSLIACSAQFDSELFEKTLEMQNELSNAEDILKIVFQSQNAIRDCICAEAPMNVLKNYYMDLMALSISQADLNSITIPTLLIYGENDPVITLKQINFMDNIPNATKIIYTDGGHFIPLTLARDFNKQLLTFIYQTEESNYVSI